jgi:hypothetical protein
MRAHLLGIGILLAGAARAGEADTDVRAGIRRLGDALVASLREAQPQAVLRLAVLPFEPLTPEAKDRALGQLGAELLASRLLLEPRLLQVERARLDPVLGELQRSEKGELSPDGAASVGKLVGASTVVLGSVAEAGPTYVVTARLVDTETARVIAAADRTLPREGFVALSDDLVEKKTRAGAALRSAVLPGWGQLYDGDTARGALYLGAFGLAAAGATTSAWLGARAEDDYHRNRADTVGRRSDADAHYQRANVLLVSMGVVWAAAVADAWLTGRDATVVHTPPEDAR